MTSKKIVTFYSYKGGVGRSMALANVALIAAKAGKRVLVLDFDLEAPGLATYFRVFSDDPDGSSHAGVIDRLWDHVRYLEDPARTATDDLFAQARLDLLGQRLLLRELQPIGAGSIDFIPAGRSTDYGAKLDGFDWQRFYRDYAGAEVMARWKQAMLDGPWDLVLIDSRTGETEVAGICTQALAERVVLCVTHGKQNAEGCARVAAAIAKGASDVEILPVAMRVERNSADLSGGRSYVRDMLEPHATVRDAGWWVEAEIAYQARHGQGEPLVLLEDDLRQRGTLLQDLRWLTEMLLGEELADQDLTLSPAQRRALQEAGSAFIDPRVRELEDGTADLPTVLRWAQRLEKGRNPRLEAALRGRLLAWLQNPQTQDLRELERLAEAGWDWLDAADPTPGLTALLTLPLNLWGTNREQAEALADPIFAAFAAWVGSDWQQYRRANNALYNGESRLGANAVPLALKLSRVWQAIVSAPAAADPEDLSWQRELSVSHNKIGDRLAAAGDGVGALASYRAGLVIRERLAAADPTNSEWQRDLSVSHNKIGDRLAAAGDKAGAKAAYQQALGIAERLAALDPSNATWQADLANFRAKVRSKRGE